MDNVSFSFLLTTLAGLSTLLGGIAIFFSSKKNSSKILGISLSFAAGVMISVSVTDLIPEALTMFSKTYLLLPSWLFVLTFFVLGVVLSMLIDKYFPDQTLEHPEHKTLYRVGFISMLAIILHNLPEGIATFMTTNRDVTLGITLTIAIALHNIPEGISISVPIYYATGNKKRAFLYTFLSGLSEPLGALLAYFFLSPFVNDTIMGCLFSIIAGIMMHISFYELLPTARNYGERKRRYQAFLFGVIVMLINHFCFH